MSTVFASAFSPGHITGFFQICDQNPSPVHKGSKGAGLACSRGVNTLVSVNYKSPDRTVCISFNGVKEYNAVVSKRVLDIFFKQSGIRPDFSLSIFHTIDVPMGAGYGTSGAGALSLSLALDRAFHTDFSPVKMAEIAHTAEVECKTGLGTVIGETFGGIEIRVEPGAPGTGKIVPIQPVNFYKIVSLNFGKLSTSSYLSNEKAVLRINETGGRLVDVLLQNPTVENFMDCSRIFAEETGLITRRLKPLFDFFDGKGIRVSMPIFGEGIFTVVPLEKTGETEALFRKNSGGGEIVICDIDFKGARSDEF
ncbi:MAG: GHMP kinase [Spirochaetales bacterium]|nr:GHMP kinase [Spirochaetales bacterium]